MRESQYAPTHLKTYFSVYNNDQFTVGDLSYSGNQTET